MDARRPDFSSVVREVGHYDSTMPRGERLRTLRKQAHKPEFGRWNSYNSFRNLPLVPGALHTGMEYGRPLPTARSTARAANQSRRLHARSPSISGWSTRFRQTAGALGKRWIAFSA